MCGGTTRIEVAIDQCHCPILATEHVMKTFESKHIRFSPGFFTYISPRKFEPAMMAMLEEQGKEGWELRDTFHEGFEMHVHFIFAREVAQQSQQHEKSAA
jgi:hypothetical protein